MLRTSRTFRSLGATCANRLVRAMRHLFLAISVTCITLFFFSLIYSASFRLTSPTFMLTAGRISVTDYALFDAGLSVDRHSWPLASNMRDAILFVPQCTFADAHILDVPILWLAFLALFCRWLVGPPPRKGNQLCAGCGYDLRGNVSGVCPECGSKTAPVCGADRPVQSKAGRALRWGGSAFLAVYAVSFAWAMTVEWEGVRTGLTRGVLLVAWRGEATQESARGMDPVLPRVTFGGLCTISRWDWVGEYRFDRSPDRQDRYEDGIVFPVILGFFLCCAVIKLSNRKSHAASDCPRPKESEPAAKGET